MHGCKESILQPRVHSIGGIDGDIQLAIAPASGLILLDAQGCERGTDGRLRHNHGAVRLTYDAACDLRDLLDQIAEPAEPRQPRLWSDATFSIPIPRPRARRAA